MSALEAPTTMAGRAIASSGTDAMIQAWFGRVGDRRLPVGVTEPRWLSSAAGCFGSNIARVAVGCIGLCC